MPSCPPKVLGEFKELVFKLLLIGVVAMLLFGALTSLLGQAMARPLNIVVQAIQQLASGEADLSARLPVRGHPLGLALQQAASIARTAPVQDDAH
ncbi:hypothetical protein G7009_19795 [Pseudomonas capeferrum]|uniref:HAMP domain-containing protein n=1 Tax=Pseudomonas capeferrum TaxID=1495066 RepID=UPI0015E2B7D4|nr:HAMP domain-containing protein [Pseudomonas capeferrum]MBA1203969.1 hypothetical protein [Pseudomonas capeferrum]